MSGKVAAEPHEVGADVCEKLTQRLLEAYEAGPRAMHHLGGYELPQVAEVVRCVEEMRAILFPGFIGPTLAGASREELALFIRQRLEELSARLRRQIYRGLHHRCQLTRGSRDLDCAHCAGQADHMVVRFVHTLPELRARLALDVEAAYDGDPAATGTDEVVFCYPGVYAITCHRIAHQLLAEGSTILPRVITEHAHERTGIDIHPGATIGASFFIDHGTGVVIGETTVIGDRVRIYQGVTLGAISLPSGRAHVGKPHKRHPTIEDDAVIYAGATILGGDTVIGRGAVIGGNCWITKSVPPGGRVLAGLEP